MKNINNKIHNNSDEIISLVTDAQKYHEQQQLMQANCLYQQVLNIEPANIIALNGLGLIAMDAGMLSLSVDFFNAAWNVESDNITVNKNLALVFTRMSQFSDAIIHYIHILDLDENNDTVHGELARLYQQEGNLDHALSHYRLAFRLNPADPRNFHGLVHLDTKSITSKNIEMVEKLLFKSDLPLDVRSSFYFGLGAVYDKAERYDEAFANYSVANITKGVTFGSDKHTHSISNIINTFDDDFFEKYAGGELNSSSQPVFIVGMPCSGANLIEKILSSNTKISTAGELDLINNISQKLEVHTDSGNDFSVKDLNNYAQYYLNDINNLAYNNGRARPEKIINKLSENYLQIGLIYLLFPNAHIIHCIRNPLDVCLANYFKNFSADRDYAYDQKNIVSYYKQYERMMEHWKSVLPVDIHTVNYEDLVMSPEETTKEMFEFIDLNVQSGCVEFLTTKHDIDNVGVVQPKNYKSSLKQWKNYSNYMHLSIKQLGAFNYTEVLDIAKNMQQSHIYH